MITITESAQEKIKEILIDETPESRLRMFIQGGGCSGFSYGFTIDEVKNEDDFEITSGGTSVLIDSMSAHYVTGAEIDFVDDLQGSRFNIKNPKAESTCGCGSSFSPG
jgi:iron-sulfur cluster insertion protein